ncbi:Rha family transcriptional regulator [Oscillibacter sp.]|uniref:Rha family transcriptional regulator n=1 Tax=Oscillibacter sp. TaxID=1945593 RepID=UPI0028974E8E|nr:Rha family transcriptional regulator [Oscillibacter sp.]
MKNDLMIFERREHAVVGSRVIAERFGKQHRDVVRAIENKEESLTAQNCAVKDYFVKGYFEHNGNQYKEYFLTRDGFSFVVMGFTGREADLWKLKYIQAFNAMESFIRERQSTEWLVTRKQGKLVRRNETDTIANLIDYAKAQGSRNADKFYIVYSKLVNGLVGVGPGQRDSVPFKTISTMGFLEDMILHTADEEMQKGTHYKEIYQICKCNGEQIMRFAYLPELTA